ncbi:MAG TPA: hypothetical protein VME23_01345 [Terracidiphilus sp.]|nr:hypothetical protein [Terracidiphilus sp.]
MNAIRIVLVLATVGGGFAGILAAANGFWTTNVADNRLLELLWFSLVTYSIITIAGLIFVIRGRVGRFMMLALGSMVPWIDLPGIEFHLTSVMYTAITFGPPHSAGRIGAYFEWSAQLGSQFQLRIGGSPNGDWNLGINLFAVLLLLFAWIYKQLTPGTVFDS